MGDGPAGDGPHPGLAHARLGCRGPFDWTGLLGWYAVRALPACEQVTPDQGGTYRLGVQLPGGPGTLTLRHEEPAACITVEMQLADRRDAEPACTVVRRLLDLDADPAAIDSHLADQPVLGPLVRRRPGVRIPGTATPVEALLRALTGQQVSVQAGRGLLETLVSDALQALDGGQTEEDEAQSAAPSRLRPFPPAEGFLADGLSRYRGPATRGAALLDALELAAAGGLDPLRPVDDVAADLAAIRGIGPWTIAYTLMRGYGHADVDLSGDRALAVRLARLADATPRQVLAAASPWRTYAALHLWGG